MFHKKLLCSFSYLIIGIFLCSNVYLSAQNGTSRVVFSVEDLPQLEATSELGIRGSVQPLSWDKSILIDVNQVSQSAEKEIVFGDFEGTIEFKYVIEDRGDVVTWEGTENRTVVVDLGEKLRSTLRWNKEQIIDISKLSKINSEDLMLDFELIKTIVLDVHPGTYRYRTKEEVVKALADLKRTFGQSLTYQETYIALSRLTAFLQCDHTKPGFNNQGRLIQSIIHGQKDKLPFTFKWFDELDEDSGKPGKAMIIEYSATNNDNLPRGTHVLSIDGVSVQAIYEALFPLVAADGATDENRKYKLQIDGYDFRYSAFDVFYSIVFPQQDGVRNLKVVRPNSSDIESVEVESVTREERNKTLVQKYSEFPKSRDDMWSFEILEEGIAMLKVNSFGLFGWKALQLDYKAFLEDVFEQIKDQKVEHLVLDIRENTGGNDEMKKELFKYFMPSESYRLQRLGKTRFTSFPDFLKPHIRTWGDEPWFYELEPDRSEGEYFIFEESYSFKNERSSQLYTKEIYLLTSPANTSLAFYTANEFQLRERGIIIGEETGGNLRDVNGGQIIFLTLPNTGIEIDFPVMGGFTTPKPANSGVQPDVLVKPTKKDLISKHDAALVAALELIRSKK